MASNHLAVSRGNKLPHGTVKEVRPDKPRRTMSQVNQLLLSQAPKMCPPACHCETCPTDQPTDHALVSSSPSENIPKSEVLAGFSGKTLAGSKSSAEEKLEEAPKKTAVYRNGATSICSPLKLKRGFSSENNKEDPEDVKRHTKYRASLYRSAAGSAPVKCLSASLTGKKVTVPQVSKRPTVFQYWRIMHAKPSGRKNKIWEDDGTLAIEDATYVVRGSDGKELGRGQGATPQKVHDLSEGKIMLVGCMEIQLLEGISQADYRSGAYLL